MIDNLLALQVKPLDVATPLLQARRVQQMETEQAQSQFNLRQSEMGAEFRGLAPYVNHPEFAQRWGEAMDRLHQKGILDPQRYAQLRNTPSPLLLQQGLAMTSSMEQYVKLQELEQSRQASAVAEQAIGAATGDRPAAPTAAPPAGSPPSRLTPDPTLTVAPRTVAQANGLPTPPAQAPQQPPAPPIVWGDGAVGDRGELAPPGSATPPGAVQPTAGPTADVPLPRPRPPEAPQLDTGPGSRVAPVGTGPVPHQDRTTAEISPSLINPANRNLNMLVGAAMQRNLPEGQRQVMVKLIEKAINDSQLTPEERQYFNTYVKQELAGGRRPLVFDEWLRRVKRDESGENTYDKGMAEIFVQYNKDSIKAAGSARSEITSLTRMSQLLNNPNVYQGAGGGFVANLKRIAASMGIDTSGIREGAANSEAVNAIGNQITLQLRNPAGGAGMPGAMSDNDLRFLRAIPPGLSQTQGGNKLILDYQMRVAQRSIDVERLRQRYVLKNGRLDEGFFRELDEWSAKNPIFTDQDVAHIQSATAPSGPVRGTTQGGVTFQQIGP